MAIMIEIRIPKEIKNYREKLFFGLTLRQCICAGVALLICVPLYIFGNKFLPQEALSWLVILIAAPLMLAGFFRYNDIESFYLCAFGELPLLRALFFFFPS